MDSKRGRMQAAAGKARNDYPVLSAGCVLRTEENGLSLLQEMVYF